MVFPRASRGVTEGRSHGLPASLHMLIMSLSSSSLELIKYSDGL